MPEKPPKKSTGTRTGPKPEVLKLHGDWREAVKRSLAVAKPPGGWPKN